MRMARETRMNAPHMTKMISGWSAPLNWKPVSSEYWKKTSESCWCASESAQRRRYDAVWEIEPRTNSIVSITWGICNKNNTRRAGKLYRARSRLYQSQRLQVNTKYSCERSRRDVDNTLLCTAWIQSENHETRFWTAPSGRKTKPRWRKKQTATMQRGLGEVEVASSRIN